MTPDFVPICTIFAGPNGAGKSTIIQELAPPGEVVNEADPFHLRIASLIGEGLGISVDAVFRSGSRDS